MFSVYLDDLRTPCGKAPIQFTDIVRSYEEFIELVTKRGKLPDFISFDHDLGDIQDKTGYDVAKWIVEQDMNGVYTISEKFKFNVHSTNPVGATNIRTYLDAYLRFKFSN